MLGGSQTSRENGFKKPLTMSSEVVMSARVTKNPEYFINDRFRTAVRESNFEANASNATLPKLNTSSGHSHTLSNNSKFRFKINKTVTDQFPVVRDFSIGNSASGKEKAVPNNKLISHQVYDLTAKLLGRPPEVRIEVSDIADRIYRNKKIIQKAIQSQKNMPMPEFSNVSFVRKDQDRGREHIDKSRSRSSKREISQGVFMTDQTETENSAKHEKKRPTSIDQNQSVLDTDYVNFAERLSQKYHPESLHEVG